MARLRYWKITPDELDGFSYPEGKLLNWDIKCTREPEGAAVFVGVFLYRNGTPLEYTPQKGIAYYHNNVPRSELPSITRFLKRRYGGDVEEKGERVFLKDSEEVYSAAQLAGLARDLQAELSASAVVTLEFGGMSEDEAKEAGLPEAKLLPVPGG